MDWRIAGNLRLHGPLNLDALRRAIQELVNRHDALRTTINHAQPSQTVHSQLSIPVTLVDLTDSAGKLPDSALTEWLAEEIARPFDLWNGPLMRVHLLKLEAESHLLSLAIHHIITDGWSTGIILEELAALYAAECQGNVAKLPTPHQYHEFVQWQALGSEAMSNHERYWLAQFRDGFPIAELPTDYVRPSQKSYRGDRYDTRLDAEFYSQVKAAARRQRATLFMTLLSAHGLLLHHLTGQAELVIGTPTAGRSFAHSERMVGYCTHFLPMRSRLTSNMTIATYLAALKKTVLAAYKHQDYPFARLLKQLKERYASNSFPALTTIFNLDQAVHFPDLFELRTEVVPSPVNFALVDYRLDVVEVGGELWLNYEYSTDLFDEGTIARWHEGFHYVLEQLLANPEQSALALRMPAETREGKSV